MKKTICILFTLMVYMPCVMANVYLIIYATNNGETGHCGIAVDNYSIYVRDQIAEGKTIYTYDTVYTGTLTYFDLWPEKDTYKGEYDEDTEPRYYQLPSASFKQLITLKTLQDQGLPHKLAYACDGIIALPSSKHTDLQLLKFLKHLKGEHRPFNAMKYNCCDFSVAALTFISDKKISGKEYVLKDYVTTPNQLYKEVSGWPEAMIIKDPGTVINGSFVHERILTRFIPIFKIF